MLGPGIDPSWFGFLNQANLTNQPAGDVANGLGPALFLILLAAGLGPMVLAAPPVPNHGVGLPAPVSGVDGIAGGVRSKRRNPRNQLAVQTLNGLLVSRQLRSADDR